MEQPNRPPGLSDLYVDERLGIAAKPCLRSGHCCKVRPCAYGTWDAQNKRCVHLLVVETLPNGAEVHGCGKYDEIVQDPQSRWNPAFGAGCSSTLFNDAREAILAGRYTEAARD